MKKIIGLVITIGLLFSFLGGCNPRAKEPGDVGTPLEFIILDEDEIPEKLQQKIEEEKEKPFQLSFSDGKDLYIVIGYGQQETGGYSIKVHTVEKQPESIRVITELIAPKKGETVIEVLTYPYIVMKTKDLQLPVEFETIP